MNTLLFTHSARGEEVSFEFEYEGDMLDNQAKFNAALAAWNAAHTNEALSEDQVKAGRWGIFYPTPRTADLPIIF